MATQERKLTIVRMRTRRRKMMRTLKERRNILEKNQSVQPLRRLNRHRLVIMRGTQKRMKIILRV